MKNRLIRLLLVPLTAAGICVIVSSPAMASSVPSNATHVYIHLQGTDPLHYKSGLFRPTTTGTASLHVGYQISGSHGGPVTLHVELVEPNFPSTGKNTVILNRYISTYNASGYWLPAAYYPVSTYFAVSFTSPSNVGNFTLDTSVYDAVEPGTN